MYLLKSRQSEIKENNPHKYVFNHINKGTIISFNSTSSFHHLPDLHRDLERFSFVQEKSGMTQEPNAIGVWYGFSLRSQEIIDTCVSFYEKKNHLFL